MRTHIDDFLDLADESDDPLRLPKSKGASENVLHALKRIRETHEDPSQTFVLDCDTSVEWRPKSFKPGVSPCMTYSRSSGLWITSRGRRMRPHECMRVQGIGYRRVGGLGANKIREMVGNSMHVGTVAAVVRLLIQRAVGG